VQKIEDCAATAVLNRLDVREGSQGNSRPSVYSFRYSSPRCFSPLLLSAPFPDIRRVGSSACLPNFNNLTLTLELVLTYWAPAWQCSAPEQAWRAQVPASLPQCWGMTWSERQSSEPLLGDIP
jgi:hypothetical protein